MLTWWIDSHLNNKTKVFDETVFLPLPSLQTIKNQFTASSWPISQLSCLPDNVYIFFSFSYSQPHRIYLCTAHHHADRLRNEEKPVGLVENETVSWSRWEWQSSVECCTVYTRPYTSLSVFIFMQFFKEKEEATNRSGIDTKAARSVEQQENNWIKWYVDWRPADCNNSECLENKLIPATMQGARETKKYYFGTE